ncbi:glycosyltransferase family protein, partial [Mycobacterium avium]
LPGTLPETCDLVYGDVVMRSTGTRHAGPFDLDRLLFETNMCHQSIFYRRKLFEGIGPYNLRYPIWADWDFNIRCFSNPALVTCYMDIVVARYN